MTVAVRGPAWSAAGLDLRPGRFPLSVERHLMGLVDRLVPGITTVTPHAQYYTLHGLVGMEAERVGLDDHESFELLRRCEVVVAAVSTAHAARADHTGLAKAHGADRIARYRGADSLELSELSRSGTGGYAESPFGFWGPYSSGGFRLGLIAGTSSPRAGPLAAEAHLDDGFSGLLDLAREDRLGDEQIAAVPHLCVCQVGARQDGMWLLLRMLSADPRGRGDPDFARGRTLRLIGRTLDLAPREAPTVSVQVTVGYGSLIRTDPILSTIPESPVWQGLLLRATSVNAWRRLWAWLVNEVDPTCTEAELADRLVLHLPSATVDQWIAGMPDGVTSDGIPLPAESQLDEIDSVPLRHLSTLLVGGARAGRLPDDVGPAFERKLVELGPTWVWEFFDARRRRSMHDVGRELVGLLLARARRVALAKLRRRADGSVWLPTRLHDRAGQLIRLSAETSSLVQLRINEMCSVLCGLHALRVRDGVWELTDTGRSAMRLP